MEKFQKNVEETKEEFQKVVEEMLDVAERKFQRELEEIKIIVQELL